MIDWQPIASAPYDGSVIMVAVKGAELPALAFFSSTYKCWIAAEYYDLEMSIDVCGLDWVIGDDWPITHWRPVPATP